MERAPGEGRRSGGVRRRVDCLEETKTWVLLTLFMVADGAAAAINLFTGNGLEVRDQLVAPYLTPDGFEAGPPVFALLPCRYSEGVAVTGGSTDPAVRSANPKGGWC